MQVSVIIELSVAPVSKHQDQMRSAAASLTDDRSSVRVVCPTDAPRKIQAQFSVPDARQIDVVDRIGRRFWEVEDYQDLSIGFSRTSKPKRRTRGSSQ